MSYYPLSGKRVWIAGHRGMVGSAVARALEARGDVAILKAGREVVDLKEHIMETYSDGLHINVGTGEGVTIRELAETAAKAVGYHGVFEYDTSKPDGMPRKLTEISRLRSLGWAPKVSLEAGIADTYRCFLRNYKSAA